MLIGAAMEVPRELGCGFLEAVYHEAFVEKLRARAVDFQCEVEIPIRYKGRLLRSRYRADLVCFSSVVVELKAIKVITHTEEAQIINYLKATSFKVGLLVNFGGPSLEYKRFVL